MQMPLRSIITSLLSPGFAQKDQWPKGTNPEVPRKQALPESRPFTSRKVWCHTLGDLQLDTSEGWAALPLAVKMPTCSSPPCAPVMKRQQALSSPSEEWVAVHVSGCQPVELCWLPGSLFRFGL